MCSCKKLSGDASLYGDQGLSSPGNNCLFGCEVVNVLSIDMYTGFLEGTQFMGECNNHKRSIKCVKSR